MVTRSFLMNSCDGNFFSAGREEGDQCNLLAAASGLISPGNKGKTLPSSCRVLQTSLELRLDGWGRAHPFTESDGASGTANERTLRSRRHDIVRPNHDRDYRSLCVFLSPLLQTTALPLRAFDVLQSGIGDTVLQINALGDLGQGQQSGFADSLRAVGISVGPIWKRSPSSRPRPMARAPSRFCCGISVDVS